jgi:elongation factor G-like protein
MCLFAVVVLAWHPHPALLIENGTEREHFPPEFFAGVEEGVRAVMEGVPVRVVLVDALHHLVDSSHRSFAFAGRMAARDALRRLPFVSGSADARTARQLTDDWRHDRDALLLSVRTELTNELHSFQEDSNVWWRAYQEVEHLVRLGQNAPLVPTRVDLELSLSLPLLLKFLDVEQTWRDAPGSVPQELASRKLSSLTAAKGYELQADSGSVLLRDLRKVGLPYLEEHSSVSSLLSAPGYMDLGTRSALHCLSGSYHKSFEIASDGLEKSVGFPRQRMFCECVLKHLREKG